MRHYEVRDVMTVDPVAVTPATPIKDVAEIMVTQRIGAVPVVTPQGRVAGLVAEADLLRKEQLRRDPDGQPWRHLSYRDRRDISTAETAGELMSTHPVTVRPAATTAEAARLMDRHQARCLPVVDESGKLLGVVSPRDLLRIFLRPDEEIKAEIIRDVLSSYLHTNPALVQVDVTDGVARLTGEVERKSMLENLLPAVRAVDGVVHVEGQLRYAFDDTVQTPRPEEPDAALAGGAATPDLALVSSHAKQP